MKYYDKEKPIYCDNHILVLEKPAGVATQPDFHEMAKSWVKKTYAKPGNVFLEPIHRLDKPVKGLVLFARTSKALSRMNEAMRERKIKKNYLALLEGIVEEAGTLEHFLSHGEYRANIDPKGKKAILHFKRIETFGNNSHVEIELETGRYHQIRAQFAAIGHPVKNDSKYGAHAIHQESIALHHYKLTFPHPITKEEITCQSSDVFFS